MNYIYFLFFGFISSLIGTIGTIISSMVIILPIIIFKRSKFVAIMFTVIAVIAEFFFWFLGATTGLLIVKKYIEGGIIISIIALTVLAFLHFRIWKIDIQEYKKRQAKVINPFPMTAKIATKAKFNLFYAIIIPLVLFSIKPEWISPYFSFLFEWIENYLPNSK